MVNQHVISGGSKLNFSTLLFFSVGTFFALLWYWKFHSLPLMQPDSLSYIDFLPMRTVGYPYFLWVVQKVFGILDVIPVIHLSCLTLSATYLVVEFYHLTKTYFLALLLMVGLMVNPVYDHAFNIMTEPLSISLLMVFLGIVIRLFQRPTLQKLALLSVIVGLSILIRPVHYAYMPVLVSVGLWVLAFSPFRFFQVATTILTPLIILIFLGCWGQYAKNGIFRLESMNGFNMIGKVSLIADKNISGRYHPFLKEVAEFAAPVQEYLDQTPNLHIRYLLSVPYYDYFRYQYLSQISRRVHVGNTIYNETSWDIIKARFFPYCKDVWINFCALWQLYDLLTVSEKKLVKSFLDSHQSPYIPYPWYPNTDNLSLKHNPILVWGIRGWLLAICFSGLVLILAGFRFLLRRGVVPPLILIGATTALVTQGHFLLTALVQAGLPRYSFALWPAIVLVGIIVLEIGRQKWKGYFSWQT